MEKMFAASPHFVRCIKPNRSKQPDQLDSKLVMDQVCYHRLGSFTIINSPLGSAPFVASTVEPNTFSVFPVLQFSEVYLKPGSLLVLLFELNPNPSNDRGATGFVCKGKYGLNTVLRDYLV